MNEGSDEEEEGNKENDSCVSIYFQSSVLGSTEEHVMLHLLEGIIDGEMFDALRTKQ